MKKNLTIFIGIFGLYVALYAQLSFPDADLNGANGLLFTALIKSGGHTWKNLYKTELDSSGQAVQASIGEPQLVNCFPQKMDSLRGGKFLQIRNADGVFMYNAAKNSLNRIALNNSLYPTPANAARVWDHLTETAVSPDGNWICYLKKTGAATADVVLLSAKTGKELTLIQRAEFSFTKLPVLWSPDSAILVYEKNARLYFIEPENAFEFSAVEEKFRQIGDGSIASVFWAAGKKLMYIHQDFVFSLSSNELYTRALYSAILGTGEIAGRLPWAFNSNKDKFWTDETGTQILISQAGKNVFYFELEETSGELPLAQILYSHALAPLSPSAMDCKVFWISRSTKEKTQPVLWLESIGTKKESAVYALNYGSKTGDVRFEKLDLPKKISSPSLSPDKKLLAFIGSSVEKNKNSSLFLYDPLTWKQRHLYEDEPVVSFAWLDKNSLYVGGTETVRKWDFQADRRDVLFLSAVSRFGWDETGTGILASCSAGSFKYKAEENNWFQTEELLSRQTNAMNTLWRIMKEKTSVSGYTDILFVRSLKGASRTLPLLKEFLGRGGAKPRVSFAIDALDNQDGLAQILSVLGRYSLTGSFFINGEFIRRFPQSVLSIAEAGHECASLFYTTADLASDDFLIDESFVRRGLARNEDEFFALTGTDIKLFWHSPYYRYSPLIEKAGNASGYVLVKDVLSCPDTLSFEEAAKKGIPYLSSAQIIENLAGQLKDGAVIPLSTGFGFGTRTDYLYEKLDVLINAIFEAGYNIVPISDLLGYVSAELAKTE